MSIAVIDWAFKQTGCNPGMKLVLLALANHADDQGACWPSQKALAKIASMTDRAVRDNLTKLETAGLIERKMHGGKSGNDLYSLRLNRKELPDDKRKNLPVEESSSGNNFRSEAEESAGSSKKKESTKERKIKTNRQGTVRGKASAYALDPRREPFTKFAFETYAAKYGELLTDGSDWKAQAENMPKTHASLDELQRRWLNFLESEKPFHREQGHPLRFFWTNFNAFWPIRGSPAAVDPDEVERHRKRIFGDLAK